MVFPVIWGRGRRLFKDDTRVVALRLVESKPVASGVLTLVYRPASKSPGRQPREARSPDHRPA